MVRYKYRSIQVFWAVRREAVRFTLVSASSAADASAWIPLSSWSGFDDSVPSCFSSSMIPLSSVVNGWETCIGPASVFPAEFRNVNMTSKKAEKIILLFCKINYSFILKKWSDCKHVWECFSTLHKCVLRIQTFYPLCNANKKRYVTWRIPAVKYQCELSRMITTIRPSLHIRTVLFFWG